jgi:hypothetical protein
MRANCEFCVKKIVDTFCAPDAFASVAIPAAGSCVSENRACAAIVGHCSFGVIRAVFLSIQPDVVGQKVACYEET